jgi:hypothetical protein
MLLIKIACNLDPGSIWNICKRLVGVVGITSIVVDTIGKLLLGGWEVVSFLLKSMLVSCLDSCVTYDSWQKSNSIGTQCLAEFFLVDWN